MWEKAWHYACGQRASSEAKVKNNGAFRASFPNACHWGLSSERSLLLSGRTVLPQENWKEEEERRGEGREKRSPVLCKNNWDLVESGIGC